MVLQGTEWQPLVHWHYTCGNVLCVVFLNVYISYFFLPLSLSMYLCIYVSMYLSIYLCMYVCIYVCMYVYIYMYLLLFGFLCFLQFPFFHLHVPPCSSSQAWQTTSLAPGLYLHGGAWMDGTWEPFSMTRCISYTWGLWGISMQVRWDIGSEMVTMGMGRCLKSWGPFPKTSKINPAEKRPLVRFNVIIFGWVPLFIFIWEALQIDVWWDLQNNMCVGWCLLLWHPTLYFFLKKWANPLGKPPNCESMFRTSACLFPNSQSQDHSYVQDLHTGEHGFGEAKPIPRNWLCIQSSIYERSYVVLHQNCHRVGRSKPRWYSLKFRYAPQLEISFLKPCNYIEWSNI